MKYLTILIMIASFAACKSTKKAENTIGAIVETTDEPTTTVMTKDTAIISMYKGGCFGKCPSYDFSINQYGEMYFKSYSKIVFMINL